MHSLSLGGNGMIYRGVFTSIHLHFQSVRDRSDSKRWKSCLKTKVFCMTGMSKCCIDIRAKESNSVSLRNIFFLLPKGVPVLWWHVQLSLVEIQSDQLNIPSIHLLFRVPLYRSHQKLLHWATTCFLRDLRLNPTQASILLAGCQTSWPSVCCCYCDNKSVAYLLTCIISKVGGESRFEAQKMAETRKMKSKHNFTLPQMWHHLNLI